MAEEGRVTVYTTAPPAYDWGWNEEVEDLGHGVRAVSCKSQFHAGMQRDRYMSGLYFASYDREEAEWLRDQNERKATHDNG